VLIEFHLSVDDNGRVIGQKFSAAPRLSAFCAESTVSTPPTLITLNSHGPWSRHGA
jgi:hypothetical protein